MWSACVSNETRATRGATLDMLNCWMKRIIYPIVCRTVIGRFDNVFRCTSVESSLYVAVGVA